MRVRRKRKKATKPPQDIELVLDRKAATVQKGTGVVSGIVRYPWGVVKNAIVFVGDRSALSDGAGQYMVRELPPGSYTVAVKVPFPGYDAPPQDVQLGDGETKVVDVTLDFKKTTVEGRVLDDKGDPIAGALLSGVLCGKDMETRTTDTKGYFKFDRTSPGSQLIRVNSSGYMGQIQEFKAKEGEVTTFEFHLNRGTCRIHGTVKDPDGKPLGALVTLSSAIGVILEKTTSNAETGHYEFTVVPDTYNLLATETEHESKGWRGPVSSETKLDFELPKVRPLRQADTTAEAPAGYVDDYPSR